jgi:hypothetical protein
MRAMSLLGAERVPEVELGKVARQVLLADGWCVPSSDRLSWEK